MRGVVATWLEEFLTADKIRSAVRTVMRREAIDDDTRLSVALKILNPVMPLVRAGEIITPHWLLQYPVEGYSLITGGAPELLEQNFRGYNFVRLGARCFALAQSLGPFDLAQAPPEVLDAHRQSGACLVGSSVTELKRRLTAKPISLDILRAAPSRPALFDVTRVNA